MDSEGKAVKLKCAACSALFDDAEPACPDCGAAKPTNARRAKPQVHIQCCVAGCPNNANVRLWTRTGWVNVCARVHPSEQGPFHYEQIEQAPRVTHNPYLDAIRAARRNRDAA